MGWNCMCTHRCETLEVSEGRSPCFLRPAVDYNGLSVQKIETTKCIRCKSTWEKSGHDSCDRMAVRNLFRQVFSTTTLPASESSTPPRLGHYRRLLLINPKAARNPPLMVDTISLHEHGNSQFPLVIILLVFIFY